MRLFNLIVYWYLKTFIIMSAKIDLKFLDFSDEKDFIRVEHEENSIYIEGEAVKRYFIIQLDKPTAIKFAKTLRTEINKIQD